MTCAPFKKKNSKEDKSQKFFLSDHVRSILKFNIPPKFLDIGVCTSSCFISNNKIERVLLDFASIVNLIPYFVYLELGLRELKSFNCTF